MPRTMFLQGCGLSGVVGQAGQNGPGRTFRDSFGRQSPGMAPRRAPEVQEEIRRRVTLWDPDVPHGVGICFKRDAMDMVNRQTLHVQPQDSLARVIWLIRTGADHIGEVNRLRRSLWRAVW
jgi:hypothetical protein